MDTKIVNTIEYHELDDMVLELFPKSTFNCVADLELSNDSMHNFGEILINDFVSQVLDSKGFVMRFLNQCAGLERPTVYWFVMYLVWIGKIPQGNLILEVSW
jgi:hypothetical protein